MSYRELRNFTEIMRTLGYPRLISMENFRRPNFELVADILFWMVKLYDPETSISDRVEFENERVDFLTSIAALMAAKARLKLNTKKLYASDGRAVQEMLKIATILYKAVKSSAGGEALPNDMLPPTIKVHEVRVARVLASEITQSGAKLFDYLASEAADRQERTRALRFLDTVATASEGSREFAFMERSLRDLVESTKQGLEDMRKESEELDADAKNLENKIRKKTEELTRTEARLKSLDTVRPQFLDETDKLEKELEKQYEIYLERYRNLDYLQHELAQYHRAEDERREQQERRLKKMRERLLKEEVELLRGGRDRDPGDEVQMSREPDSYGPRRDHYGAARSKAIASNGAGRGRKGPTQRTSKRGSAQVSGSMAGGDSDVESSDEDDLRRDNEDEELSVGSGHFTGGNKRRTGRGGGQGAGPTGGAGQRRGGGSEQDSDDFLDDDEEDDEEEDDGGEDDSGSDEHF